MHKEFFFPRKILASLVLTRTNRLYYIAQTQKYVITMTVK